ncbi:MAG TPA: Fe-S oxidoreductase [Bacteroidetes bacterium]|nr:Fe-S oxidoreductase [Bacteroidota bacterium]
MTETITREVFQNFPAWLVVLFYVVSFTSIGIFLHGFSRRFRKYFRGRRVDRFDDLPKRILNAVRDVGRHSSIRKSDPYAGFAHFLVFWGFIILMIGTALVALDYDVLRIVKPDWQFLNGAFYLWYSLILDIFGVLFIIGLLMMIVRRRTFKLRKLDYARVDGSKDKYDRSQYAVDDKILLTLFLLIAVSGFLIEGVRIAATRPSFEVWSVVGWQVANLFDLSGISPSSLHVYVWWFHSVLVVLFIAYIPYSKAMHMLTDFANLLFTDDLTARRLPKIAEGTPTGYAALKDFTWKELLDLDACTKCGRCHVACPAMNSGAPLSPRDLILDLREYADKQARTQMWFHQKLLGENGEAQVIAGEVIKQDVLWSCTSCRACVEQCPVGIEHVSTIVQMRRHLVNEGAMDDGLQDALVKLSKYGNSFGKSDRLRAKWTDGLTFKIKDARKDPVEYLWFVGDYASFNPRIQELSRSVARVLTSAGVDFGLMYEEERNSGNDVRRVGEEGLFEMLVESNVKTMGKCHFKEVFTTDPHTLNTLRHEYPEYGASYTVSHYTALLARLLDEGKLTPKRKLGHTVTFHDPCYLGRYNGGYEAPRKVLRALGCDVHDMPRCRENSFCCGAGGGRIWMKDENYKERPSENRIREALGLKVARYFVVCCPKDVTMYEDAVKTSGNEGNIVVKDIIELVEEALGEEESLSTPSLLEEPI